MNQFQQVMVGFGNMHGQTVGTILTEQKNRIQISNIKASFGEQPKVQLRQFPDIQLGKVTQVVAKKRDEATLKQLMNVEIDINLNEISTLCSEMQKKIQDDLLVVKNLKEQMKFDQFIQKTKGSEEDARKYLDKQKNTEKAVELYKKHNTAIEKFMKDHKCDKQTAVSFLESCQYNVDILQ